MVRAYKVGQKDLAAWNFVTAKETAEDYESGMEAYAEMVKAADDYGIDIGSYDFRESVDKYRDWYTKYKNVLQKEDQGLIGPEESKAILDSLKGIYTDPNVNYDLLLKDVHIPQE